MAITQMGLLREASSSRELGNGNFSLGTPQQHNLRFLVRLGSALDIGEQAMEKIISADGLRQYRPPAAKPNSDFATTGVQANVQGHVSTDTTWASNGHLNITPPKENECNSKIVDLQQC